MVQVRLKKIQAATVRRDGKSHSVRHGIEIEKAY